MNISIKLDEKQATLILAALMDKASALMDDGKRFAATVCKTVHQCLSDFYAVTEMIEYLTAGLTYGAVKDNWEN